MNHIHARTGLYSETPARSVRGGELGDLETLDVEQRAAVGPPRDRFHHTIIDDDRGDDPTRKSTTKTRRMNNLNRSTEVRVHVWSSSTGLAANTHVMYIKRMSFI